MLDKENIEAGMFTGKHLKTRDLAHQRFQANDLKVLLLQAAAGSASIDLHDVQGGHERHTYSMPMYRPETLVQILGRVDRLARKSPVFQTVVYSSVGIEKNICKVVQGKVNDLSTLNRGDLDPAYNMEEK